MARFTFWQRRQHYVEAQRKNVARRRARLLVSVAVGALLLLSDETAGFAADFTYSTDGKRVAVKRHVGPERITQPYTGSASGSWAINATSVTRNGSSTGTVSLDPLNTAVVGTAYHVTFTVANFSGDGIGVRHGTALHGPIAANGNYSLILVATSNNGVIFLPWAGAAGEATITNISVKELDNAAHEVVTTEYGLDEFFSNGGTSPKLTYDSAGVLRWSPNNRLTYSEHFDNAAWTKSNTTVTANAGTDPNGGTAADKLVPNTSSVTHNVLQNSSVTLDFLYTHSVYAKASGYDFLQLTPSTGFAATEYVNFNLATGAIAANNLSAFTAGIESIGNGWYRCWMSGRATSTTASGRFLTVPLNANTAMRSPTYAGNGTSGILVFGAQLNRGTIPTAYLPTTTAARFGLAVDHDPVTLARKGLLVEPAATNLLLRSSEFDNASWSSSACSHVANVTTAPDGNSSADRIVEDATLAPHGKRQSASIAANTTYVLSFFAKAGTRSRVGAWTWGSVANVVGRIFNLLDGTTSGAGGFIAPTSYGMNDVGNGWWRCWYTIVANGTGGAASIHIGPHDGGASDSYQGNGTGSIDLWQGQLETGSVATSPIVTYGATVTRAADVVTFAANLLPRVASAISLLVDWDDLRRGVLYGISVPLGLNAAGGVLDNTEELLLRQDTWDPTTQRRATLAEYYPGSTDLGAIASTVTEALYRMKIAGALGASGRKLAVNGEFVASSAAAYASGTAHHTVHLGHGGHGHIRSAVIVPRAWSETELETRTAL